MIIANYTGEPADLAVDLVNTFGWVSGIETLHTAGDLRAFLSDRAEGWPPGLPDPVESDLDRVRSLRSALHAVFASPNTPAAVAALDRILAGSRVTPVLTEVGGVADLRLLPAADSVADWIAVVTAMGLASVVAEEGLERLGVCSAHNCQDAFLDTSRNRSRRHCSDGCRSRENVAAFRRRRRDPDQAVGEHRRGASPQAP